MSRVSSFLLSDEKGYSSGALAAAAVLAGVGGAALTAAVLGKKISELEKKLSDAKSVSLELKECGIRSLSLKAKVIEANVEPARRLEIPELGKRPSVAENELALFLHPICPFAHRAWWLAAEKLGIEEKSFRAIEVDLSSKPDWYEDVYSAKTVPAMQYGPDVTLGDSRPVCEWIDANMDGIKFSPSDAATKTAMESALAKFGSKVVGPCYRLLKNQDPAQDEALARAVADGANWFNEVLVLRGVGEGANKYFAGSKLSMFEILSATFFARFAHTLKHWRGFNIMDGDKRAALVAWMKNIESRPAFAHTTRSPQYFILGYSRYAQNEVRTCAVTS